MATSLALKKIPLAEVDLGAGISNVDLVAASGIAKSKGEARRLLSQGGIARNGQTIDGDGQTGPDDVLAGRYIWIRRGKKTDAIVVTPS